MKSITNILTKSIVYGLIALFAVSFVVIVYHIITNPAQFNSVGF